MSDPVGKSRKGPPREKFGIRFRVLKIFTKNPLKRIVVFLLFENLTSGIRLIKHGVDACAAFAIECRLLVCTHSIRAFQTQIPNCFFTKNLLAELLNADFGR